MNDVTTWNNQDVVASQWFNACSTMFLIGERMFIDSVRYFQEEVKDPTLQSQIRGFIQQEAMHSSFHLRYNRLLRSQGYNLDFMDRHYHTFIKYGYYFFNPRMKLAITAACEHITASLGDIIYQHNLLSGAKKDFAELWKIHIIEEIEHKAVAFDTLKYIKIGYFTRSAGMFIAYTEFTSRIFWRHIYLLYKDGNIFKPKIWWRMLKYKWGKSGINRLLFIKSLAYLKLNFHPWQHNNYFIVEEWQPRNKDITDETNCFVSVPEAILD